jgi:uncharacterized protein (TIGR03435 family)
MEQLGEELEQRLATFEQTMRPVIDNTGLKAKYDFKLEWQMDPDRFANGLAFQSAMERAFGLKLEQKQQQVEMLVVDHAEKLPTEN